MDILAGLLIILGVHSNILGIALLLKGLLTLAGALAYRIIDPIGLLDMAAGILLLGLSFDWQWSVGLLLIMKGILMLLMSIKAR